MIAIQAEPPALQVTDVELLAMRRIRLRFLPLLIVAFLITYLDRVNVGFAALTANRDLGLSQQDFAWGASIFFLGYFLFELPSNMALERFGARLWLARVLVTIGLVSAAMALVQGARSFYFVRFALGVAEAGLFPGVILFMTRWFPKRHRARDMALFMLAIPLSSFLGAPISGLILGLDGQGGLHGWQWLYIIEGAPAILLGLLCLVFLTDRPEQATWLRSAERAWLLQELASERMTVATPPSGSRWRLALNGTLLTFAAIFFGVTAGTYGLSLWLPLILKTPGYSDLQIGLVVAVPFGFGCIATLFWGRQSDRLNERVWHTAVPAFLAAAGLALCLFLTSLVGQIFALSLASLGLYGVKGPFWALATERLTSANAAPGIAIITSLAGLAGFAGPYSIGWIKAATGSFELGLLFLAALCLVSGALTLIQARQAAT